MMSAKLDTVIKEVFYNVQFNRTTHQQQLKKLKKCYDKYELEIFWNTFIKYFRMPLSISQRHPHVENTLRFVAVFATSFYSCTEDDDTVEPMCPFLAKLFDFLLSNHSAKHPAVRFRICNFLNMLLNSMGDQASIDDSLCDKITVAMMDRLMDKSSKVRAQAIFSLHRLQDPSDDDCPVIKMYIFHASKDPRAEVRRAAIMSMGKNQKTLQTALKRTRDIDESVRKASYEFISKVTVRSLTIKQRDQLLSDGLKDRSEVVRKTVRNTLLPAWLRHFNGEFINLVRGLDAEIGTETSILALDVLFKSAPVATLIEQVPIDKETKLIPIKNLCSENTLYWKCLVKYLSPDSGYEAIIPELSHFCEYVSEFLTMMSAKTYEKWEVYMQKFVLLQLFEIVTVYDLSDEVGRKNLNELICNTLMSNHCSTKIIECIVSHLEKVIPDKNKRIHTLVNVISEIRLPMKETQVQITQITEEEQHTTNMQRARLKVHLLELKEEEYKAIQEQNYLQADSLKNEINKVTTEITRLTEKPKEIITEDNQEEKNDPETMIKCLTIIGTMMQSVTTLTPTLRTLMQLAVDSLDHEDDSVHILALKVLGIYCILDKELAKKHIMVLFLQFSVEQENLEIWNMALKGIFDLLLLYGLEYFDIVENEEKSSKKQRSSRGVRLYSEEDCDFSLSSTNKSTAGGNCNFLKIFAGLLDNADQGLRTIATEGLCKLLLNRRISSSYLLSRLIILSYNPVNDDDFYLRQCLSAFFNVFISKVPDAQEMLEQTYLPTLRTLCSAPEISPLQDLDPYDVSRFILGLTRRGIRKIGSESYCAHNNLAFTILGEVLNPDSKIDQETLIKSLKDLCIEIEDNVAKENLLEAANKVSAMVSNTDKRLMRYIDHFKKGLVSPHTIIEADEDEDTEVEE